MFQWLTALCVGVGLSATCGFRVFVPLLGLSLASKFGHLPLAPGFQWLGSWLAIVILAIATGIEIAGYYVPFIDNLLDTIATPAAALAGTAATAAVLSGVPQSIQWSLAVIAGGGAATAIQSGTVLVRGGTSAATGGTGNFLVSTGEMTAAIIGTIVSIVLPFVAVAVLAVFLFFIIRKLVRRASPHPELPSADSSV